MTMESVSDEGRRRTRELLEQKCCRVEFLDSEIPLHFIIRLYAGNDMVEVEVRHTHTNIVAIRKNGTAVFEKSDEQAETGAYHI